LNQEQLIGIVEKIILMNQNKIMLNMLFQLPENLELLFFFFGKIFDVKSRSLLTFFAAFYDVP
jgi:hypothetical protein